MNAPQCNAIPLEALELKIHLHWTCFVLQIQLIRSYSLSSIQHGVQGYKCHDVIMLLSLKGLLDVMQQEHTVLWNPLFSIACAVQQWGPKRGRPGPCSAGFNQVGLWVQWFAGDSDDHNHVIIIFIYFILHFSQAFSYSSVLTFLITNVANDHGALSCHRLVIVVAKKGSWRSDMGRSILQCQNTPHTYWWDKWPTDLLLGLSDRL